MSDRNRAAYVAFVRLHHPDRGGDIDTFVAGMAEFRATTRRQTGTPDRYDAPIVLVIRKRGLTALSDRIRRRRDRRRRTRVH